MLRTSSRRESRYPYSCLSSPTFARLRSRRPPAKCRHPVCARIALSISCASVGGRDTGRCSQDKAMWVECRVRGVLAPAAILMLQSGTQCRHPGRSIYVGLVATASPEVGHVGDGLVGGTRAVLDDDVVQGAFHVLPHADCAANIEVCAVRQPSPDVVSDLTHAVLHVELALVVARPGKRQAGKHAGRLHAVELILIEEIAVMALMAEEQPVAARRLGSHALVQEGAERRDAGAGADHDDGY